MNLLNYPVFDVISGSKPSDGLGLDMHVISSSNGLTHCKMSKMSDYFFINKFSTRLLGF